MKLILCKQCKDIRKLEVFGLVTCACGKCGGQYLADGIQAVYFGGSNVVPFGLGNTTFADAIRNQPSSGQGSKFEAFVIPKKCDTMKKLRSQKEALKYVYDKNEELRSKNLDFFH